MAIRSNHCIETQRAIDVLRKARDEGFYFVGLQIADKSQLSIKKRMSELCSVVGNST